MNPGESHPKHAKKSYRSSRYAGFERGGAQESPGNGIRVALNCGQTDSSSENHQGERFKAMTVKKILFPTDLSDLSAAALEYAAALARDSQGELVIVHVEEPGATYVIGGTDHYGAAMPGSIEIRQLLEAVKPKDTQVRFHHRLLNGHPADEIVRFAEQEQVDVIVMATHGRTGWTHALMGSVAEAVVRAANCPVLSFKPEQTAAQQAAAT